MARHAVQTKPKDAHSKFGISVRASVIAQSINLPAVQETWLRFLGQEDLLEKEMATNSGILAWEIPWTEKHGGPYTVHGVAKESDTT